MGKTYTTAYHPGQIGGLQFLVTGGAGFIGSHLVQYLLEQGAGKVRVLDNLLTGHFHNIAPYTENPAFEFIEGDITDLRTCREAAEGIDYISHQAALGSVPRSLKEPEKTNAINVSGFLNMLIAAKENGCKRLIYASSSSVYGDEPTLPKVEERTGRALSPYAVSKWTNELYAGVFAAQFGMELIGLRYFNIFGPRQDPKGPYAAVIPLFIDRLIMNQSINIDGDGGQTRDFTFVENAVQANIRGMFAPAEAAAGEVYNVACGARYSIMDLCGFLAEAVGAEANLQHREPRAGDIRNSLADVSKAGRLIGYVPTIDLRTGLQRTVDHFKQMIH